MDFVNSMLRYVAAPHEIIMVNNASTDATQAYLQSIAQFHPQLQIVQSTKNLGFSGGNNLGLTKATGDIVIFLSNDTIATGDFITPITSVFEQLGPKILVGKTIHEHDTGWNTYIESRRDLTGGWVGVKVTIPYVQGYCVVLNRDGIQQVLERGKLWDDAMSERCDFEDMDLAYRAARLGWKLAVLEDLPILHVGSGHTANTLEGGRLAYTLEAQRRFKQKWGLT